PPPALSQTARFAGSLSNRTLLEAAIARLAERLAVQLDAGGWAARAIRGTLHLGDGATWSGPHMLHLATADPSQLEEAFLTLSRGAMLNAGIETLTLEISDLVPTVAAQLELFALAGGQVKHLDAALERLSTRYAGSFVRATVANSTAQLPERRVRFEPLDLP